MKAGMVLVCGLGLLLSAEVRAGELNLPFTTSERTVCPFPWKPHPTVDCPSNVNAYLTNYGRWDYGAGEVASRRFDLLPGGNTNVEIKARLASFFSISDIHITDKESPAQVPYIGWSAGFQQPGPGGLNPNAYSPVILSTTHVLDAAVRTINMMHETRVPFDFGFALGDECNSSQRNELRWFIDVMDGCEIDPASGAHDGARNGIDYQQKYYAAGLNSKIPWYAVIGNHDQYWVGIGFPTDKIKKAFTNRYVLCIGTNVFATNVTDLAQMYSGVVDGRTSNGLIINGGPANWFPQPPAVDADAQRHTLSDDVSTPRAFVAEFTKSTTLPKGHGFSPTNTGSLTACYSFNPTSMPDLKVIVLDNTCKSNAPGHNLNFYGGGWMDAERTRWLTNELNQGQTHGQLMILACHIPVCPQKELDDPTPFSSTNSSMFYSFQQETNLLATLHNYPNLILVMAGHRHKNVVTPQPSQRAGHPEDGFWEVETPSLRDFPQQFRTWEICLNSDTNLSIVTTDVDPAITDFNSPAGKSRSYAMGSARIFGMISNNDTRAHTCNAELIKPLNAEMKTKLSHYLQDKQYQVWPLRVTIAGNGLASHSSKGFVGGTGYYQAGVLIRTFACPLPGFTFSHWLQNGATSDQMQVKIEAATNTYTAVFR